MADNNKKVLKTLKKRTKSKTKERRGGKRKGSGRKPDLSKIKIAEIKAEIENHGYEEINRPKQGKLIKTRRILMVLDRLFAEAINGNIHAIKEYLNRQIGKVSDSLEVKNPEGGVFKINISTVGDNENGDKLATNKKTK